ncbi:cation-translocating P-type ATPase (plasmid) [Halarchaeum sp. CBA1220]|uniref:heavy metal translocating P-type ATPase n=1 Tax=Halarchaeum sp. CBA1220 TaxID=1853682 RepID=UPI000F3AA673|nr:cation-translocating P-type ATPase [Halarchaeum sp. CBA1220]QLC35436.1 cation-translocating P-type ATPase [Halarchaeum sp. CBA1220]
MTENPDAAGKTSGGGQRQELTVRLTVPEMDCPSCAQKVDKSLQRVDGVVDATLQPTTGTATVTYDPDRLSEDDVVQAIENAGYEVVNRGDDTEDTGGMEIAPPSEVWTSSRAIKTWIGAAFVTLGLLFEFVLTGQNVTVAGVLDYPLHVADVLFLAATVASGTPVIRGGYYSAKNLSLDIDLLMGTAIIAATGIGYFVEAATLAVLFSIAELLEDYAMDRARNSLRELMELSPDEATVRRDGEEVTAPADEVEVGETVIVRPGDKIPLDGTVVEGGSAVDESPITGESVPVDKTVGDEVYAGSINEEGYIEFEATAPASESTLSQIIEMVQGAQEKKTEKEQFVDRFAGYYTPTIVVLAILTAALPPMFISGGAIVSLAGFSHTFSGGWQTWFIRGLTLLVIACPCAFVISTPVSVVSGITSAAKNGVLIKGGNHLEAMGEVDAIAVDKTGTLTKGELAVTDVVALGGATDEEVLRHAAALEQRSEHPIAEAILARADDAEVGDLPAIEGFESITGKGVRANVDGEAYYAGKPALFEELGFDLSHAHLRADGGTVAGVAHEQCDREDCADIENGAIARFEDEGKTVVLVGTDTALVGIIAIADEVRPAAERAVTRLHELGVEHVVMLTGDNEGTARAIAERVGVDEYRAELLPDEKVDAVEALQAEYGDVAMVGDGINDAPALATADVGIAMGAAGTDTALETADIALMGDDIGKLPYLYALSHKANGVIRQNIWLSLGVKALLALGVPLGLVSVALAVVVGDMGMSLGVTGNAMRLSRIAPERVHGEVDQEPGA